MIVPRSVFLSAWLLCVSCASVKVEANRDPTFAGTLEPVHFMVFDRALGVDYTEPLRSALERELNARGIRGVVSVARVGTPAGTLKSVLEGSKGAVFIVPISSTSNYGSLVDIIYDVHAYVIPTGDSYESRPIWRARVETSSGAYGFQVSSRLALCAQRLVEQLLEDRILFARK